MSRLPIRHSSTVAGNISFIAVFMYAMLRGVIPIIFCLAVMFILNTNNIIAKIFHKQALTVIVELYKVINVPFETAHLLVNSVEKYITVLQENDRLKNENYRLRYELKKVEGEIYYNASLKNLLNVVEHGSRAFITAKVVTKTLDNFHMNLLINAGSDDGVTENDLVIYDQGLVGRVVEVSNKSARVLTISDPRSKVPIIFQGAGQQAIAAGNQGRPNMLEVKYLANPNEIEAGDTVITSGIGGVFPLGLTVGRVVREGDNVLISIEIDWPKLDYVIIDLKDDKNR